MRPWGWWSYSAAGQYTAISTRLYTYHFPVIKSSYQVKDVGIGHEESIVRRLLVSKLSHAIGTCIALLPQGAVWYQHAAVDGIHADDAAIAVVGEVLVTCRHHQWSNQHNQQVVDHIQNASHVVKWRYKLHSLLWR